MCRRKLYTRAMRVLYRMALDHDVIFLSRAACSCTCTAQMLYRGVVSASALRSNCNSVLRLRDRASHQNGAQRGTITHFTQRGRQRGVVVRSAVSELVLCAVRTSTGRSKVQYSCNDKNQNTLLQLHPKQHVIPHAQDAHDPASSIHMKDYEGYDAFSTDGCNFDRFLFIAPS